MPRLRVIEHSFRCACALAAALAIAACASSGRKKPEPLPAGQVGRPVLAEASQAMSLQSSVMALADTSMQRIGAQLALGTKGRTPEERRDEANLRLMLGSALISIASEPDPVDALADILTHTTLTADAQRNAARGKPADSPEARLLVVLEQNEADAWRLAERWLNEPTQAALRKRIMDWPGPRTSAASVAFVRLSDIARGGATSVTAEGGMFDTLRAATNQADQVRLLAERSIFLIQRLPFLFRWQAEVYTVNALATKEAQDAQTQIDKLTAISATMSEVLTGMSDKISAERAAALNDLFNHVATERKATLDQITTTLQQERKTTLAEAGAAIDAQRTATLRDVQALLGFAGKTGTAAIGRALFVGVILIVILLAGLLGTMLLYRRLAPRVERNGHRR
jgi:hypothetical protein